MSLARPARAPWTVRVALGVVMAALAGCEDVDTAPPDAAWDADAADALDAPAMDAPDAADVADAVDVVDAVDTVDAVDAVDAVDVVDAEDATDATDATDAGTACARSADCAGSAEGPVCDVAAARCVRCLPAEDVCPPAQHCDATTRTCAPGCRADEGCGGDAGAGAGRRCDVARHACVQCLATDDCPAGELCASGTCVPGCGAARPCPSGRTCCAGACVDTATSAGNCGSCGAVCELAGAVAACSGGRCVVGSCTAGSADCDGDPVTGCEIDTRADVDHCGGCRRACLVGAGGVARCTAGRCAIACARPLADCDGVASNGCETNLDADPAQCGACARRCELPNAAAACVLGRCAVGTCAAGHGDCDGVPGNGCETDLRSNNTSCGACGLACRAGTACEGGFCRSLCASGLTFCGGGCVDTATHAGHCGGCDRACPAAPQATARCVRGACTLGCEVETGDCDGVAANGCETPLASTPEHCGRCGVACPALPNAAPACELAACAYSCRRGYADCDREDWNGCEVELATSNLHCGACGRVCVLPHAAAATCAAGRCAVVACASGWADCDGDPANGCEAELASDARNCGGCGRACRAGLACQARLCTPFPSSGSEGAFRPTGDVTLSPGVHNFTTITIPEGVTVMTAGSGVLDLRATGDVVIRGTIDASGGRGGEDLRCAGGASGGGASGAPLAGVGGEGRPDLAGAAGGAGGAGAAGLPGGGLTACIGAGGERGGGGGGGWSSLSTPGCGAGGGGGAAGGGGGGGGVCCEPSRNGRPVFSGGTGGGSNGGLGGTPGYPGRGGAAGDPVYDGGPGEPAGCGDTGAGGGGGGSIGVSAASDLAVAATFGPGAGGGGGGGGHGAGGGGGGGAVRVATTSGIVVEGRILADGGRGGSGACCGAAGGGGSGGAIVLAAPSVLTGAGAVISASGGAGGAPSGALGGAGGAGGAGRIRVMTRPGGCSLSGVFAPALADGCAPTEGPGVPGRVHVGAFP